MTQVIPYDRTVYVETSIHIVECADCSILFGIGANFQKRRRQDHQRFYCPNGHPNIYPQDNEAERLRKQLDLAEWRAERATVRANGEEARRRLAERQRAAAKGQVTRIKNRVGNGVCPCCNRTFQNLANHMANQHPEFKAPGDS